MGYPPKPHRLPLELPARHPLSPVLPLTNRPPVKHSTGNGSIFNVVTVHGPSDRFYSTSVRTVRCADVFLFLEIFLEQMSCRQDCSSGMRACEPQDDQGDGGCG